VAHPCVRPSLRCKEGHECKKNVLNIVPLTTSGEVADPPPNPPFLYLRPVYFCAAQYRFFDLIHVDMSWSKSRPKLEKKIKRLGFGVRACSGVMIINHGNQAF